MSGQGVTMSINLPIDSLWYELIEVLTERTDLTREEVIANALTKYAQMRLPEKEIVQLLSKYGINSR